MCAENRHALENVETKAQAIILYKKTIDWALEENYPTIETIRKYFSDCESLGVFVDREFHGEVLDSKQVYVFHHCKGTIKTGLNVGSKLIPMLYFANDCDMRIESKCNTPITINVPLYVFGSNRISAEQSDDIECKIYKFETK